MIAELADFDPIKAKDIAKLPKDEIARYWLTKTWSRRHDG